MKELRFIKNKIRLIYSAPIVYFMIGFQIAFLLISLYAGKITSASGYFNILKKDLFLWIICIPGTVLQHKVSVYSTYYHCISRIGCKRRMILADYAVLAVSTCISVCVTLSVPLLLLTLQAAGRAEMPAGEEVCAVYFFLLLRYLLLALLIQYIIYALMYLFPNLQKRGGSVCILPFFLFAVFTFPMEFLAARGHYLPVLDFSAGRNYVFAVGSTVLWGALADNAHIAVGLALVILITPACLSKRWEFFGNETVGAP